MDKKKYQIFISSTFNDLVEARKKVQETILAIYHFPIGMEYSLFLSVTKMY